MVDHHVSCGPLMQSPWIRAAMWGTSQLGDFLNGWHCLGSSLVTRCRVVPINIFFNLFNFWLCWPSLLCRLCLVWRPGSTVIAVHGLLIAAASLVADMGFRVCGLSSCETWACSMWNLPRPGIKLMPDALAGRFLTTGPPGKSPINM